MDYTTIGYWIVGVATVILLILEFQKRAMFAKIEHYFTEGDYRTCLRLLDNYLIRFLYPKFNRLFMRLNVMLALDDANGVIDVLDSLFSCKMNARQKYVLYGKAFMFYLEIEDEVRAKQTLKLIQALDDEEIYQKSLCMYEIYFEQETRYIPEMLQKIKTAQDGDYLRLCQLLAMQYENKGNKDRAEYYYSQVRQSVSRLEKEVL